MRSLIRLAYEGAAQLARAAAVLAPAGPSKAMRSLRARRNIRDRFATWGRNGRIPAEPLLWMHAPSVGEGLQARPVLHALRRVRPHVQLAYTFFSPSAESFARTLDVDFREYLPFDSAADADAALQALLPRAIVFSKLDVWPTLVRVASARGVRLGLISATVAAASKRRSAFAAPLLRDAYGMLDMVGAVSEADALRLRELGVRPEAICVTGDTRYDQVSERAAFVKRDGPILGPLRSKRPTLVAGSTWPADERALLDAWERLREDLPGARLIIAPHEPTEAHLRPIEAWAKRGRLDIVRLSAASSDVDVILVDRVGVLGDLYALADIAFVGGGFHDAGLHSVLEPASFGVPVAFGPGHDGSRDAGLLLASGGGASVDTATALRDVARSWFIDDAARKTAGDAARETVRAGLGATERSLRLIERLLDD
ncbi:MAG: hypothetical protein M3081_08400 [Gemmatimonadota bacterium]|nr:hypothetical protein [Gemmatimonadota bacterium]